VTYDLARRYRWRKVLKNLRWLYFIYGIVHWIYSWWWYNCREFWTILHHIKRGSENNWSTSTIWRCYIYLNVQTKLNVLINGKLASGWLYQKWRLKWQSIWLFNLVWKLTYANIICGCICIGKKYIIQRLSWHLNIEIIATFYLCHLNWCNTSSYHLNTEYIWIRI